MSDFLVRRDDLRTTTVEELEPQAGNVEFAVERFGLTANNVTYGVLGDAFGYWKFFAAPDGWGRVPVWGFGRVTSSDQPGIDEGDRFYGYWPMSSRTRLQVEPNSQGFMETSPARQGLAPFYNRYAKATAENGFPAELDDAAAILRPLFMTGWLIARHLERNEFFEAQHVVVLSASSKTAYATAFELGDHSVPTIGLTSDANKAFTEQLGCYGTVLTYDDLDDLPDEPLVLVDMAGNRQIRNAIHRDKNVVRSIAVGATHWEHASFAADNETPPPHPELFFAPGVADEVAKQLGPVQMATQIGAAWLAFGHKANELLETEHATDPQQLHDAWTAFVDGQADPRKGLVFQLS